MGIVDLKTDLKNLKYSDSGVKGPYVQKDINNPPTYNALSSQGTRRLDDLVRMSKMMTDTGGIKFAANQAILASLGSKGLKAKLKSALIGTTKVVGSTLAQVPVSGTGTHFIRGFGGYAYLQNGGVALPGVLGFIQRNFTSVGEVHGSSVVLGGSNVSGTVETQHNSKESPLAEASIVIPQSRKGITPVGKKPEEYKVQSGVNELSEIVNNETALSLNEDTLPEHASRTGEFQIVNFQKNRGDKYEVRDYTKESITFRLSTGNQSKRTRDRSKYTISDRDTIDQINALERSTVSILEQGNTLADIIPFEFHIIAPEPDNVTKKYDKDNFIYFRAHMDNLGDTFTGTWNSTKYIGRAEPMYTYTEFGRSINFAFKIAAFSRDELKPLYKKLNFLASSTAPTYSNAGSFMRGTYARITIGDYMVRIPGFFKTVDLTWDINYPWEVALETGEDIPRVPHILNVSCTFQPIHDFLPTLGAPFIMDNRFNDLAPANA